MKLWIVHWDNSWGKPQIHSVWEYPEEAGEVCDRLNEDCQGTPLGGAWKWRSIMMGEPIR